MISVEPTNLREIYVLENKLNQENFTWLLGEYYKMKNDPQRAVDRAKVGKKKNKLFMVKNGTELRETAEKFFAELFPFPRDSYEFYSMNYYHLENPYGLHCDNLGKEKGFYQAIVPLEVTPCKPTYTIIFEETSAENTEWISPVYKKPADYKPFHNKPIRDPNYYGGWRDQYRISEEDGLKFWGPTWDETFREAYKGFSIKKSYQWSLGDVFLFQSRYNHCASEMETLGVESKAGLLICLQKVK